MKYGIFGDIHGNLEAFEAVTCALEKEGADAFVCVGDIVGYGADPNKCIEKLQELSPEAVVSGNHDLAVLNKIDTDYFNSYAKEAIFWTSKELTKKNLAFLKKQKLIIKKELFTVVHSSLAEPDKFFYIQTLDDAKLTLKKCKTPICFFGHSHVPRSFLQNVNTLFSFDSNIPLEYYDKALIDVGSVGQPRDENPDACFVIYDTEKNSITFHRVSYDADRAGQKILDSGLPPILAERLKYGR